MKTYFIPMTKVMNLSMNAAVMNDEGQSFSLSAECTDGAAEAVPFL